MYVLTDERGFLRLVCLAEGRVEGGVADPVVTVRDLHTQEIIRTPASHLRIHEEIRAANLRCEHFADTLIRSAATALVSRSGPVIG